MKSLCSSAILCFLMLSPPLGLARCPVNVLQNQLNHLASCPALKLEPILNNRCSVAALADWLDNCPTDALKKLSQQCQGTQEFNCQDIQNDTCMHIGQQLLYKRIEFTCDYLYYLAHPDLTELKSPPPVNQQPQQELNNRSSLRYHPLPLN